MAGAFSQAREQMQQGGAPAPSAPATTAPAAPAGQAAAPAAPGGEEKATAGMQGLEDASPEEQEAYDAAVQAITDIAFGNDQSHQQVLQFLADEAESTSPTGALVKGTAMLITEVDKQMNLPESVPINLADDVFVMLQELADAAGLFRIDEKEMKQGVAAAQQMLMEAYGGDLEGFQETFAGFQESTLRESLGALEEIQ